MNNVKLLAHIEALAEDFQRFDIVQRLALSRACGNLRTCMQNKEAAERLMAEAAAADPAPSQDEVDELARKIAEAQSRLMWANLGAARTIRAILIDTPPVAEG